MNSALAVIEHSAGLPALIAGAGDRAARRFVEFFTVNIRNPNMRAAYGRAAGAFLHWCEGKGITRLQDVQPVHIAAYVERLQAELSKSVSGNYFTKFQAMTEAPGRSRKW